MTGRNKECAMDGDPVGMITDIPLEICDQRQHTLQVVGLDLRLGESTFAGNDDLVAERRARTADDGDGFPASASASVEAAPSRGVGSDAAVEQRPSRRAAEGVTEREVFDAPAGTGVMRQRALCAADDT